MRGVTVFAQGKPSRNSFKPDVDADRNSWSGATVRLNKVDDIAWKGHQQAVTGLNAVPNSTILTIDSRAEWRIAAWVEKP